METIQKVAMIPAFDEIVFESRNKEYGAYVLRKEYRRNVGISVILAVTLAILAIIVPYFKVKSAGRGSEGRVRVVTSIVMTNLDQPLEKIKVEAVQPPGEVPKQAAFIPPVVVDTMLNDDFQLLTSEEVKITVQNSDVIEVPEIQQEVKDGVPEDEPFIKVEEMPSFPGGESALLKFIRENVVYPEVALENNIQGKVIVRFCVTPSGGVDRLSILKAVDPELDREALRVVSILPSFKPGKQGGRPVPVWFFLPVTFQIKQN